MITNRQSKGLFILCLVLGVLLLVFLVGPLILPDLYQILMSQKTALIATRYTVAAQQCLALPVGIVEIIVSSLLIRRRRAKVQLVFAILGILVGVAGILVDIFWLLARMNVFGQFI